MSPKWHTYVQTFEKCYGVFFYSLPDRFQDFLMVLFCRPRWTWSRLVQIPLHSVLFDGRKSYTSILCRIEPDVSFSSMLDS
jgi:hypothetical protein